MQWDIYKKFIRTKNKETASFLAKKGFELVVSDEKMNEYVFINTPSAMFTKDDEGLVKNCIFTNIMFT